jgi:hypothetical protein
MTGLVRQAGHRYNPAVLRRPAIDKGMPWRRFFSLQL